MTDSTRLLRTTLLATLLAAGVVTLCYFFVDRPVARWVHAERFNEIPLLKWLTLPPPVMQAWVPVILALLAIRRAWGPLARWQVALAAAGVSMVLADQCRESMSYVAGRYWPETWIDNNPSLIGTGAYGFHPFHSGPWYRSFPSGHMARTVGFLLVIAMAYPRSRGVCFAASSAVAVGLIGMNYHFVGDVVAGSVVGGVVAVWVWSVILASGSNPGRPGAPS